MPDINFISIALASLVPLFIGAIYYSPFVAGKAIAVENGKDPENPKKHAPSVYLFTLIASFLIAMLIAAIIGRHPIGERTIDHGMFHGGAASIFLGITPFIVISLFEDKSWKYIFIHAIYWIISMTIMGGIIAGFV